MMKYGALAENYRSVRIKHVGASRVNPPSTTTCTVGMKPEDRLFCVTRGRIIFDTDYGRIEAFTGCVVYLPSDCTYVSHWESKDFGEYITLNFTREEIEPLSERIELAAVDNPHKYLTLFRRIRDTRFIRDDGRKFQLMSLFWELIRNLHADSLLITMQSEYASIYNALDYIACNFKGELDTEKLARICGMSASTFRREFKARVGMSPIKYRNRMRLMRARELLESGSCNVTEASRTVGIDDIFYFSKIYKREFGSNPSEAIPRGDNGVI